MGNLRSFADPSLDHPDSPFWRADGVAADETWAQARQAMEGLLRDFASREPYQLEMSIEFLRGCHKKIFAELFPDDAGRFRWKYRGEWEIGQFGVGEGSGPASPSRVFRGTSPRKINENLVMEFERFQEAKALLQKKSDLGEPVSVRDAASIVGRLYARILRIHPFIDGNLRAAFVVLQAALLSLDLPVVEFDGLQNEHDQALLVAFTPGGRNHSYDALTDLIVSQIHRTLPLDIDAL